MSNPQVANIMKAGARIWVAPVGEAIPDETTIAAEADWGGNWARIGYTAAPLKVTFEDERMVIETEEELMEVDDRRIKFSATAETAFAELTAEYLQMIFGGTINTTAAGVGQVGYEELDVNPNELTEKLAFGFEGISYDASQNKLPQRWFFTKVSAALSGEFEYSKKTDSYVNLPVLFRIFKPDSGTPVKFQRVTAPAS